MSSLSSFRDQVLSKGFAIVPDVLDASFTARARLELIHAIEYEASLPHDNARDYAMVLLCSLYGGAFLDLFTNQKLLDHMNAILGDGCIVYGYTSSSMPPFATNFSRRIHVDCPRVIPGYVTNLGVLLALDDFTADNGASYFLPDSHERLDQPTDEEFFSLAERFLCPAGSAIFFNARTWHCGGYNQTAQWRHGLSINMVRPWMKQRIDIPRAMSSVDLSGVPDTVLQKLGFHSQVPANYAEYYVPAAERKFKQKYE